MRVIDFMPPGSRHDIIRIVVGIEGEVPMHCDLSVRFAYGKLLPWIQRDGNHATLTSGPDALSFDSPVALRAGLGAARAWSRTSRCAPASAWRSRSSTSARTRRSARRPVDAEKQLERRAKFWREWAGRCKYQGRYRDAVIRSLLTLKVLTHEPTGGIVAAPTTSLPEELRGVRNWDYRFCWLRDSTLTLDALMRAGYLDEAKAWRDWLMRAAAGAPTQIQIMYGVAGEHRLTEVELPWLPGYE